MLNRHQLRIKVFKAVYAYEHCREANQQLAVEQVYDALAEGVHSKDERTALKTRVRDCFFSILSDDSGATCAEDGEMRQTLETGVRFYRDQNARDLRHLEATLHRDIGNVRKGQFSLLRLLLEFAFQNRKIAEERSDMKSVLSSKSATSTGLYDNRIIAKIREKEQTIIDSAHHSVFNVDDRDMLRDWYKGTLNQDPEYKTYLAQDEHSYRDDWDIVEHILRQVIFRSENINNYFEEADINWTENKPVIRSLILKTMKSVAEENGELTFAEISYNWDDDENFYKVLFKDTIQRSAEVETLITSNLENWDINRIALTDKVILQTAICEMIAFPSIPVKVTINEYIEISKTYSTPKSKNFVNGLLDVISGKLLEEGVIRKSGRGLMDNK
jgi:N utilization substance protein B